MVRSRRLRRTLGATFISAALLLPGMTGMVSATEPVSLRVCNFDWQEGTWHIKQLIKCAARRWDSPGSPVQAIEVARCESSLRPDAYNAGGYAGLFQQATRYWPGRAHRWGQPERSVFNGRANIIVSIRMAASIGSWSAWAGCG